MAKALSRLTTFTLLVYVVFTSGVSQCQLVRYDEDSSPPSITVQPSPSQGHDIKILNDRFPLRLSCRATGMPPPTYRWIKFNRYGDNPEFLDPNDKRITITREGDLEVANKEIPGLWWQNRPQKRVQESDKGLYQCIAENALGLAMSRKVNVSIAFLDNWFSWTKPKSFSAKIGDTAVLHCNPPDGLPASYPYVYWTYGDRGRPPRTRVVYNDRILKDARGNLVFANVRSEDNRDYRCNVPNSYVDMVKYSPVISLNVVTNQPVRFRAPSWVYKPPKSLDIFRTYMLQLNCIAGGNPTPRISWRRRKNKQIPLDRISSGNGLEGTTLEIRNVSFEEDGQFRCAAYNGVGTPITYTFRVNVMAAPYWHPHPPQDTTIAANESVRIACQADGRPVPLVTWLLNGKPEIAYEYNPRRQIQSGHGSGYISIIRAEQTDTAVFQCIAKNKYGAEVTNVYLNVQAIPAKIRRVPNPLYDIHEGDVLRMSCESFGKPDPTVTWSFDGKVITSDGRFGIEAIGSDTGTLTLPNVTMNDSGLYVCKATNHFGTETASTRVIVRHVDECSPNPCLHAGRCIDGFLSYRCECNSGYIGIHCETDVNECSSNPCSNGGVCVDQINGYMCECVSGYTGPVCETDIDECILEPCLNGATCIDGVNGYRCDCISGYTGILCETDIDECLSSPCLNDATCVDKVNSYTCDCITGYEGVLCETVIDECTSGPCLNGATCNGLTGSYSCTCAPGYTGINCETDINECISNPCSNEGTCIDDVNGFVCLCSVRYRGDRCETDIEAINECLSNPCMNGATCIDDINLFKCECADGYFGELCDAAGAWTEWTECSTTCGIGGTRERVFACVDADSRQCDDRHGSVETDNCNGNIICPTWAEWGSWGRCSVTCGHGFQERVRICHDPSKTRGCEGLTPSEIQNCEEDGCPLPKPQWSSWSRWTDCSATCNSGLKHRRRNCTDFDTADNVECVGQAAEEQACNDFRCPDCLRTCAHGVLNADCDACVCDTSVLNGRVTDANNRPLSGATIAYTDRPYVTLATTNSTGMFSIEGICSNPDMMTVKKPMFTTADIMTTFVNNVESYLQVTLTKLELPFISENPRDKIRLVGQSVAFCCRAESNPPPKKYEWFKDGDIIETPNATNDTFILHDLQEEDSGLYRCRVHNDAGAVYSDEANLTVTESVIGCNEQPVSLIQRLPNDCVQPETYQAEYDIGMCEKTKCASDISNQTLCADPSRESYCCQPIQTELKTVECTGYNITVRKVVSCGCGECVPVPSYVSGTIVSWETGEPLRYVNVYYKKKVVAHSNPLGNFLITTYDQASKLSITLRDDYFDRVVETVKVVQIKSGLTAYCKIKMKPKPQPIAVNSSEEANVPIASDNEDDAFAELVIEPDTMYDMNGNLYMGMVKVSVDNVDLRNASNVDLAPGDFSTVDENGDSQFLRTYNLWSMETKDEEGNPVSIGGSSMVVLDQSMLPPCEVDENGNCGVKLWALNPESGSWEIASELKVMSEEVKRRKRQGSQGTFLIGNLDVTSGIWYNIDDFDRSARCWAKVVAHASEELGNVLTDSFSVQSVVEEPGFYAMYGRHQVRTTTGSASGICVPMGCETDTSGAFTVRMTAIYMNQYLTPADGSHSKTFRLNEGDISNLSYDVEVGETNSAIKFHPIQGHSSIRGPIHAGYTEGERSCLDSNINDMESKYFQFFKDSISKNVVYCSAKESVASHAKSISYITFYNFIRVFPDSIDTDDPTRQPLQIQKKDTDDQKYCFVGIRIHTNYRNVRIKVTSSISNPSGTAGVPGRNTVEAGAKGYTFGERLMKADPVNGVIDTCMEFKCGGDLYDGLNCHGEDETKVVIEVEGVAGRCSVNVDKNADFDPDTNKCHKNGYNTPFCFIDPNTYGDRYGIFQWRHDDVETKIGSCNLDTNSPQNTDTRFCQKRDGTFQPAFNIECSNPPRPPNYWWG